MTLLVAGHETTATALAWAFDMLLHTPGTLERAREAARGGDDRHLDAVAFEALRLRPVVPSVGRALGVPGTYGGFELEVGTPVLLSNYLLQTRPDLYPDPYEFRPERFAESRPETYQWMPFGGGVRRCLGAAFAELEMRVVLREVLSRTDLRAGEPAPARPRPAGVTLVPEGGVPVVRG
jgi:cytochrome P450